MVELVEYQDQSIVSKRIIQKDAGTVTLFAFDRGEVLSEHTSPYDALIQVLEGEAEITISGSQTTAKEGQFILLPANQPHLVKAPVRFKMQLTMIR